MLRTAIILWAALLCAARADADAPKAPPIRLVVIDHFTQEELGPLPWPRGRHAKLIRWLSRAGARAIALRFYYRDSFGDQGDRDLVSAVEASRRVLVETGQARAPRGWQAPDEWLDAAALKVTGEAPEDVVDSEHLQLPFENLARAVRGIGSVDLLVDSDKRYQAMPLIVRHRDRVLPSLGLRVFLSASGLEDAPLSFAATEERILGFLAVNRTRELVIANTRIKLDSRGCSEVDLSSPRSAYQTFSFVDVLNGKAPARRFRGAIVVVGADLPGSAVQTPLGPKSGAELVADQIRALYAYAGAAPAEEGVE